tara:strand:+ start:1665 stop:2408 length:744 start_codon:yes stop_codon:yes gene_type:complete
MGFDFGAIISPVVTGFTNTINQSVTTAQKAREAALTHLFNIDSPAVSTPEAIFIGPPEPPYNPPDDIEVFNDIADTASIPDRFNMSEADVNAYVNTIAKEAYLGSRQPDGSYKDIEDIHSVAANLLTRQIDPRWPNTMLDVTKDPGQYEANFGLTKDQVSRPNIVGLPQEEWNRIKEAALDTAAITKAAELTDFAVNYRGLSPKTKRGVNPKTGLPDYMPVPNKSNFYFSPAPEHIKKLFLKKVLNK